MTQRERVLGISVGGMVLGLGLVWGAQRFVVDPIVTQQERIVAEQGRRGELSRKLAELSDVEREWKDRVARTLSEDPREAQLKFRENMLTLLERHGLLSGSSKDTKVTPGAITFDKAGFVDVPLTIQTTGTLKEIVGFLVDFYRQDYTARIDRISMSADQTAMNAAEREKKQGKKPAARPGANGAATVSASAALGPDGPPINVNITATTLVLPKGFKGIKATPAETIQELETGRLRYPIDEYAAIVSRNLFAPYRPPPPPPPVVATPPPQTEPNVPVAPVTPPPPPPVAVTEPPRESPESKRLVATTVTNGRPMAYVTDDAGALGPSERQIETDEPFDNGTLLLVHPRGVVVRVTRSDSTVIDYFYPLRAPEPANFNERVPLSADGHSEIIKALESEFTNYTLPSAGANGSSPVGA